LNKIELFIAKSIRFVSYLIDKYKMIII